MRRDRGAARARAGAWILAGAAIGLAAAGAAFAERKGNPDAIPGIEAESLMKDVRTLASPKFGGRLAGSPGYDEAARWAAKRFEKLGLRPGGDAGGYLQVFPLEYNAIESCRLSITPAGGAPRALAIPEDFTCRGFTGSGTVSAPVVFAGFGLSLPDRGWDDYAGLDVAGKIVLVFKDAPPFDPPRAAEGVKGWGDATLPRPKALAAQARGAVGLLMVSLPKNGKVGPPIASVLHGPGEQPAGFPQQHVSGAVAAQLLAGSGATLESLAKEIAEAKAPRSRPLGSKAAMTVVAKYRPDQPAANVVAILPGGDPELRGRVVVLGAHLDHVGTQEGVLWPGANDNASGSAALLAVAEAFAKSHRPPRQTLVFVLFAAEEQGLNGSRWFAERMPYPPDQVVAMLNIDCVGHGDGLQLGGGKSAPHLWELARTLDAAGERITIADTWAGGGADATPFHEKGIPTLYFASTKSYTHLHQASDRPETLNPALLEKIARLAFRTARSVSDGAYDRETVAP
jgi:hypothetical protein